MVGPNLAGQEDTGERGPEVATEVVLVAESQSEQPKGHEEPPMPPSPEHTPVRYYQDQSLPADVEPRGCEVAVFEQLPISPTKCPSPSPEVPAAPDAPPEGASEPAGDEEMKDEEVKKVKGEGVEEVDDLSENGDPPVVPRIEQWKLREKPKRAGRGAGRGRGRGRGKKCKGGTGVVEIVDSGDERDEQPTKPQKRKPRAKAKAKAKAKASTRKSVKEPAEAVATDDKDQGKKKQKDDVVWKVVETREGLEDLARAFGWATSTQDMSGHDPPADIAEQPEAPKESKPEVEAPPEEPEPSPSAKRARRGESTRGLSFARRFRPKSSPAAERWDAITNAFETDIFPYMLWYGLPSSQFQVDPMFLLM